MWWAASTGSMPSAASTRTSTRPAPVSCRWLLTQHPLPQPGVKPGASAPNRFYMYGVIGRLAMLAASYELEATDPDAEDLRISRRMLLTQHSSGSGAQVHMRPSYRRT